MLKEHEIKEKACLRAERKWNNAEVRKKVKEAQRKPNDPNAPPRVAELIENDGRKDGRVNRFENKFKRDIRQMMEGHSNLSVQIYLSSLEHRKRILPREKLRRLKMAQNEGEEVSK